MFSGVKWKIFWGLFQSAVLNGFCFGPLPYSVQETWEELVGIFFGVFSMFFGGSADGVFFM